VPRRKAILIRRVVGFALLATAVMLSGCSQKSVQRIDTDTDVDLSGAWNDADSRRVAEALTTQITDGNWVIDHMAATGQKPVVIIGRISNKTVEHIPTQTFIADLERSFINGNRVSVVASPEEREQMRTERADQQEFSSLESMKQWGRELGADYMMIGEINMIVDQEGSEAVKFYQVDAYLADLETNVKVWAGQEKIKKYVGKDKVKL
jgi:uncharacterized protein (TIGR02722 family)